MEPSESFMSRTQNLRMSFLSHCFGQNKSKSQLRFKGRGKWVGVVAKSHYTNSKQDERDC